MRRARGGRGEVLARARSTWCEKRGRVPRARSRCLNAPDRDRDPAPPRLSVEAAALRGSTRTAGRLRARPLVLDGRRVRVPREPSRARRSRTRPRRRPLRRVHRARSRSPPRSRARTHARPQRVRRRRPPRAGGGRGRERRAPRRGLAAALAASTAPPRGGEGQLRRPGGADDRGIQGALRVRPGRARPRGHRARRLRARRARCSSPRPTWTSSGWGARTATRARRLRQPPARRGGGARVRVRRRATTTRTAGALAPRRAGVAGLALRRVRGGGRLGRGPPRARLGHGRQRPPPRGVQRPRRPKPSYGRVSRWGLVPYCSSLDRHRIVAASAAASPPPSTRPGRGPPTRRPSTRTRGSRTSRATSSAGPTRGESARGVVEIVSRRRIRIVPRPRRRRNTSARKARCRRAHSRAFQRGVARRDPAGVRRGGDERGGARGGGRRRGCASRSARWRVPVSLADDARIAPQYYVRPGGGEQQPRQVRRRGWYGGAVDSTDDSIPMVLLPMVLLPMVLGSDGSSPMVLWHLSRAESRRPSTARRTAAETRRRILVHHRTSCRAGRRVAVFPKGGARPAPPCRATSSASSRGGTPRSGEPGVFGLGRRFVKHRSRLEALRRVHSGARTGVWGHARIATRAPAWTSSPRPPRPRSRPGWRTPMNNRSGGSTPNIVLRDGPGSGHGLSNPPRSSIAEAYAADAMTVAASLAGVPAVSVPVGLGVDSGLPVGAQVVAAARGARRTARRRGGAGGGARGAGRGGGVGGGARAAESSRTEEA